MVAAVVEAAMTRTPGILRAAKLTRTLATVTSGGSELVRVPTAASQASMHA